MNMVDFTNGTFLKLKKIPNENCSKELLSLLLPEERLIGTYVTVRDSVVFTDKRVISMNVQGITGKKKDFTSMPYNKISVFSVETSGVFDLDSELEMYFSGLGKVRFEFTGHSDIVEIGKIISEYAL